jgi:hypothetical protein
MIRFFEKRITFLRKAIFSKFQICGIKEQDALEISKTGSKNQKNLLFVKSYHNSNFYKAKFF